MDKEWENEPDSFDGEFHGYKVKMKRNHGGAWCGYVGLPRSHPWHGRAYNSKVKVPDEILERPVDVDQVGVINLFCAMGQDQPEVAAGWIDMVLAIDVHGGITYADEADDLWWIGFDCSHAGDLSPRYHERHPEWGIGETYRNADYVKDQVENLAKQLKAVESWEVEA